MIIDLTHTITKNIIVFPASPQPQIELIANPQRDGFNK